MPKKKNEIPKTIEPKIDLHNDEFGMILNFAVRYACGRRTYAPSSVIAFITPLLPYLNDKTLWCFNQDVSEAYARNDCGDPNVDAPRWAEFLAKVKAEQAKRKETSISSWLD